MLPFLSKHTASGCMLGCKLHIISQHHPQAHLSESPISVRLSSHYWTSPIHGRLLAVQSNAQGWFIISNFHQAMKSPLQAMSESFCYSQSFSIEPVHHRRIKGMMYFTLDKNQWVGSLMDFGLGFSPALNNRNSLSQFEFMR